MEFFILFPTTLNALTKIMPDDNEVGMGILVGSTIDDLEKNWIKSVSQSDHAYNAIAVFRLNDLNHEPPQAGWLEKYGAMNAGYDLEPSSFFGCSKPWKVFNVEDYIETQ